MEITTLILKNDNPTTIELEVTDGVGGTAEYQLVTVGNLGEAFMQVGEAPVERFSLVPLDTATFPVEEVYGALLSQKPTLISQTPYGDMTVKMLIVGVLGLDHPDNPSTNTLTVEHRYRTVPFLPADRKELTVRWSAPQRFAEVFDLLHKLTLSDDIGTEVTANIKHTTVVIRYNGTTDRRHLDMNKRLASTLGSYDA